MLDPVVVAQKRQQLIKASNQGTVTETVKSQETAPAGNAATVLPDRVVIQTAARRIRINRDCIQLEASLT